MITKADVYLIVMLALLSAIYGCTQASGVEIKIEYLKDEPYKVFTETEDFFEKIGYKRSELKGENGQILKRLQKDDVIYSIFVPVEAKIPHEIPPTPAEKIIITIELNAKEKYLSVFFSEIPADEFSLFTKERYQQIVESLNNEFGKARIIAEDINEN